MSNQVELILNYQKIDEELFKAEKEFSSNEDNQKYVRAVKKVKSVQEKLEEYEKKAQLLLDKYNSLLSQKDTFVEEKVQLEKTVQETSELVAIDYLKGQISLLASKMDSLKTSLEELEKEMQLVNSEYFAFAKEIKEAKEFGASYKETFAKLKKEVEEKKVAISAQLAELESGISAEFLAKYKTKRLDKQLKFPLVRGCNGTHCSFCGMELSISARNTISPDNVIECENCHKFVFKEV